MTMTIRSVPENPLAGIAAKQFGGLIATTPARLRLWAAGVWLLAILFGWVTSVALDRHRHEMQTIGKDSAPSIVAAQTIKWTIADLHGSVIRGRLGSPQQSADAAAVARQRRAEVTDGLITAAKNITYGDAEQIPIRDMLNGMAEYDDAIARADVLASTDPARSAASLRNADAIVHDKIYPAANELHKANENALDHGYTDEQSASGWATAMFAITGLGLMAVLAGAQWSIRRRTHRRFSPALAGAGLVTVFWAAIILTAVRAETHDLKAAKEDAFDSVIALWQARADATDAQAALAMSLLDPQSADTAGMRFDRDTSNLARISTGQPLETLTSQVDQGNLPEAFKGYIADELRNITYDGEKEAADEMFQTFAHYVRVAGDVRKNTTGVDRGPAVDNCLGTGPDQARGALAEFDAALDKTLKINQTEFDRAVDRGFADVAGFTLWNVAAVLAIAGLAQWGISQRLAEYRR